MTSWHEKQRTSIQEGCNKKRATYNWTRKYLPLNRHIKVSSDKMKKELLPVVNKKMNSKCLLMLKQKVFCLSFNNSSKCYSEFRFNKSQSKKRFSQIQFGNFICGMQQHSTWIPKILSSFHHFLATDKTAKRPKHSILIYSGSPINVCWYFQSKPTRKNFPARSIDPKSISFIEALWIAWNVLCLLRLITSQVFTNKKSLKRFVFSRFFVIDR